MSAQPPFDVAIIGAGPGGYVAAIRAGQLGLKAVVIERDSRFGGTCTLRGCIPTKALLRDAHLLHEVRKAVQQGLFKTGAIEFDFDKIQARKNDIIGKSNKGIDYLFRKNKVTVVRGSATLISPTRIAVSGDTPSEIEARNIIIATGSEAKPLPGYTVDEKRIITNVGALDMAAVPQSLVVVGAGAVGVEFASIYNAFGTKVTLLEALPQLVPLEDEEIAKELRRVFTRKGIDCYTSARLESAKTTDAGIEAVVREHDVDEAWRRVGDQRGDVRREIQPCRLALLGRDVAHVQTRRVGDEDRIADRWDQQARQHARVEAAGTEHDEVGLGDGGEGILGRLDIVGRQPHAVDTLGPHDP